MNHRRNAQEDPLSLLAQTESVGCIENRRPPGLNDALQIRICTSSCATSDDLQMPFRYDSPVLWHGSVDPLCLGGSCAYLTDIRAALA